MCLTVNDTSLFLFIFSGPSFNVDTACSSGLEAFCNAVMAIREGRCDSAIIGTVNLVMDPNISKSINVFKMLSPDGACKSFDESGKKKKMFHLLF